MITLYVLGSGSRGNCCAVEAEGTAVLIDAGFSRREVERRAEAVGLDLNRIAAIALTHEHGDHACGAAVLARRLGVPVLTAQGTWQRLA
ncbi:MAG TPA: MBL fold metallo-hydrolase, partial [Gemmatimonadales bacterium]|nr:MBL fold metallo-hydrolase [Gemmatimonadales bacterium]